MVPRYLLLCLEELTASCACVGMKEKRRVDSKSLSKNLCSPSTCIVSLSAFHVCAPWHIQLLSLISGWYCRSLAPQQSPWTGIQRIQPLPVRPAKTEGSDSKDQKTWATWDRSAHFSPDRSRKASVLILIWPVIHLHYEICAGLKVLNLGTDSCKTQIPRWNTSTNMQSHNTHL